MDLFADARGLQVHYFRAGDLTDLERVVSQYPCQLVWLETPANPTWNITDIRGAATIAHQYGARLGVDSTCATPVLTQPIELGADLVAHSATKYLNGHSDVLAGVLVTARSDDYWEQIRAHRLHGGAVLSARDAHLLVRGMRNSVLTRQAAMCQCSETSGVSGSPFCC